MEISSWPELITVLGIGSIIGSIVTISVQHLLKQRAATFQSQRKILEERYKVIILLMYAVFNFNSNKNTTWKNRPNWESKDDILEELEAEWYNMILFASEKTQITLHSFIKSPSIENLKRTASSMRHDLGRGYSGAALDNLLFDKT